MYARRVTDADGALLAGSALIALTLAGAALAPAPGVVQALLAGCGAALLSIGAARRIRGLRASRQASSPDRAAPKRSQARISA